MLSSHCLPFLLKGVNNSLSVIWPKVTVRGDNKAFSPAESNQVFDFTVIKPVNPIPLMNPLAQLDATAFRFVTGLRFGFPQFIGPFVERVAPHCYDVIHDFCLVLYQVRPSLSATASQLG